MILKWKSLPGRYEAEGYTHDYVVAKNHGYWMAFYKEAATGQRGPYTVIPGRFTLTAKEAKVKAEAFEERNSGDSSRSRGKYADH